MKSMVRKWWMVSCAAFCLPALAVGQDCDLSRSDGNCDGILTAADVIKLKTVIIQGTTPDPVCFPTIPPTLGDLNCDRFKDASDLMLEEYCVIGQSPLGSCPIPNVRPTVPDPRDSVIIVSKVVAPLGGACGSAGLRVQVYITNKDSQSAIFLPLETRAVSGNAYGILSRPFSCGGRGVTSHTFDFLYPVGPGGFSRLPVRVTNLVGYHSDSPDTFLHTFWMDTPVDDDAKVPPNLTRFLLGEIKFDSVTGCSGAFEIDSSRVLDNTIQFVDNLGRRVPVNFVKGVVSLPAKGDMDASGDLTAADVVLELNCTFLGTGSCSTCFADLNCDGVLTASDVVSELNLVFLGTPPSGCP